MRYGQSIEIHSENVPSITCVTDYIWGELYKLLFIVTLFIRFAHLFNLLLY